ncbi:hypothetical protein, partial [Amycolatopsis pretoriensis]|uniref:hypothetical protein n=1 Tax=Amycolatopsis pretoriensis TaxID=218821 RepID=UPI001B80772E
MHPTAVLSSAGGLWIGNRTRTTAVSGSPGVVDTTASDRPGDALATLLLEDRFGGRGLLLVV